MLKRTISEVDVEERFDVERAKRLGGVSNNKTLSNLITSEVPIEPKSTSGLLAEERFWRTYQAEERYRQRFEEELIKTTGFYSLEDLVLDSLGHSIANGRRPLPAGFVPSRRLLERNLATARKIAKGGGTERGRPRCPSRGSSEVFLPPKRGSRASQSYRNELFDGRHATCSQFGGLDSWNSAGYETASATSVAKPPPLLSRADVFGGKDTVVKGSLRPRTSVPNLGEWRKLFAPEAIPILFPAIFVESHETLIVDPVLAPAALDDGTAVERRLDLDAGGIEMAEGTTTEMTMVSATTSPEQMNHSKDGSMMLATNAQHLPSTLPPSQHEANTDRLSINTEAFRSCSSNATQQTMASENHMTGASHEIVDETIREAPQPSTNGQDGSLGQPQWLDETLNTAEAIGRAFGLSPEELAESLTAFREQRWREGNCLPSCNGECHCTQQSHAQTNRFA